MSRSNRHQHAAPQAAAPGKQTGNLPPVTEVSAIGTAQSPEDSGLYGRLIWISILVWLTCFLGLALTVWLDLIIGAINWVFFRKAP